MVFIKFHHHHRIFTYSVTVSYFVRTLLKMSYHTKFTSHRNSIDQLDLESGHWTSDLSMSKITRSRVPSGRKILMFLLLGTVIFSLIYASTGNWCLCHRLLQQDDEPEVH